jgi:hypothetical protein
MKEKTPLTGILPVPSKAEIHHPRCGLTEERFRLLVAIRGKMFGSRHYIKKCATAAGVSARILDQWITWGREEIKRQWEAVAEGRQEDVTYEGLTLYGRFAFDFDRTATFAELDYLRTIEQHGKSSPKYWQALAWLLERGLPESYSTRPEPMAPSEKIVTLRVVEKDGQEWQMGHIPGWKPPIPASLSGASPAENGEGEDGDAGAPPPTYPPLSDF